MIDPEWDPPVPARRPPRWLAAAAGMVLVGATLLAAVGLPQLRKLTAGDPAASSQPASVSTEPTIAPRAEWSYHLITRGDADDSNATGINGIAELRGRLYAWGRAALEPGIWVSEDGANWTATEVPPTGNRPHASNAYAYDVYGIAELRGQLYAWGTVGWEPAIWVSDDGNSWRTTQFPDAPIEDATIVDMVETSDRLVAVAVGGNETIDDVNAQATMTMIYISADGESWQMVDNTPGIDAGAHGIVVQAAGRLVAVGGPFGVTGGRIGGAHDTWVSNDGGLSWSVSATADELNGWMTTAAEDNGLIVGAGYVLDPQCCSLRLGPALVWTSSDGGTSWARQELSADAHASEVLFGEDGRIVITGIGQSPSIWVSDDQGETWAETKPHLSNPPGLDEHRLTGDVTAVPGGYAATVHVQSDWHDLKGIVWTSPDAITWTEHKVDFGAYDITWTPTYGLIVLGFEYVDDEHLVALAPQLLP